MSEPEARSGAPEPARPGAAGNTAEAPRDEQQLAREDDAIIAQAFRWSLAIFLVLGAGVGLTVWLLQKDRSEPPVEESPVALPERQEAPATPPAVQFTDVSQEAGIDFVHENGATGDKLLPETMGPGCAFLDYDTDGDQDLLFVNGRRWDGPPAGEPPATCALYANDGQGHFQDVTGEAGLDVSLYGMGAAVGDLEGDGDPDVFITAVGENRLLMNEGGRFVDRTAAAGVAGSPDAWSTSAGFFDAEHDGDLDLFVCNYVQWSPEIDREVDYRLTGVGRAYGPPTNFQGAQSYFYRNLGDGTFREEAQEAGLHVTNAATEVPVGKALALLVQDVDQDGWTDIVVANDTVANFLFRNLGDGTFEETGGAAGIAYDAFGDSTGAMGIDAAFYRGDDSLAIGIGNFSTEMSSFYVADDPTPGDLHFTDEAVSEGVGPVSRQMLSFGLFFFDYDLDGRLDLFQTNGHLEEEIHQVQPSQHYEQPSQLFWNCGPGHASCFVPVPLETAGDLARPVVGRGAAYADLDGDGDLDVVVMQTARRPLLLRNDQELGHRWIRLRLQGSGGNRDALGALVEVTVGDRTQVREVTRTRSYLAQVEPALTFGLGDAERADQVRVRWPGTDTWEDIGPVPAGTRRTVRQER